MERPETTRGRRRAIAAAVACVLSLSLALPGCAPAGRLPVPIVGPIEISAPELNSIVPATVVRVVDGDTMVVKTASEASLTVRLIGIDTPESTTRQDPYGKEASGFVDATLPRDLPVYIEYDVEPLDQYHRDLVYLWLKPPTPARARTDMLNSILVAKGLARLYTYPPNVKYTDTFFALQQQAREGERGLWALPETLAAQEETVVVTPSGRAYHRAGCTRVGAKSTTLTVAKALDRGYSACRICQPPR